MAQNQAKETLQKLLFAGVGLAVQTAEKYQSEISKLAKKGKFSEDDVKKATDELTKKVHAKRVELEGKFNKAVEQYSKVGETEVTKLTKKIQQLESTLAKKIGGAAPAKPAPKAASKPAAKKAAPKKAAKKAAPKKEASN